MRYKISFSCISHAGNIRSVNQDNFICNGQYIDINNIGKTFLLNGSVVTKVSSLFGVFDGMGGEECGEIASYIAAKEAASTHFNKNSVQVLREYCERSNKKICEYAENNSVSSMGTTAAMLLFSKHEITLCNIGDSKIFRFSGGELEQISKDHVEISAFGTKPPLSQNLGIPPSQLVIDPYLSQGGYNNGDKYLICSDGLSDKLEFDEIKALINNYAIEEAVINMVDKALLNGSMDNITAILLQIKMNFSIF